MFGRNDGPAGHAEELAVPRFAIATPEELRHAHRDPAYRQQLVVSNLQKLIELMNQLKANPEARTPEIEAQLREGADLAVQLSDVVKRLAATIPPKKV
jgi:hypothetical protein